MNLAVITCASAYNISYLTAEDSFRVLYRLGVLEVDLSEERCLLYESAAKYDCRGRIMVGFNRKPFICISDCYMTVQAYWRKENAN